MKIFLRIFGFATVLSVNALAQSQLGCGFNKAYEQLFANDKNARANFDKLIDKANQQSAADHQNGYQKTSAVAAYTIPVVFHVLHKGGNENITDAQILDQVAILNRDYQKMNADTANIVSQFKNLAADCSIQFSLATLDENGKCTNGITRHYDNRTNWAIDMSNYVYTWDPSKYLNIYVVKSLPSGVAGYAYLPGTVSASADAIVILHNYIGSIGTGNVFSSRALTHEVGHWLNLQHTWGSTNNPGVACGDDGVGDTPVTKGHSSCNLSNAIDCTPGVTENIQNYMEYAYCSNMFTIGQKNRMLNCLNGATNNRMNLSSFSNLTATGVLNPQTNCAPKAEFVTNSSVTCVGNGLAFVDYSYNAPVTNWLWSSPLASNTSTLQNGILTFSAAGIADVKLIVNNNNGIDSIVKQSVIVMAAANTGTTNLIESFETGTIPNSNWVISQPKYGSPFAVYTSAGSTGTNCVWVNNYFDNPSTAVNLYSPAFDLQNATFADLNYRYAYAQQNTANNDKLRVFISTNCGTSWTQVLSKSGTQLSTTGTVITQAFTSPTGVQWAQENINIVSYAGPRVYVRFEFTPDPNGPGNNFFLDDINITSILSVREINGIIEGLSAYPNPFNGSFIIKNAGKQKLESAKLYDVSSRLVSSVEASSLLLENNEINQFAGLSAGIYFLEVKTQTATQIIKLVKQ